MRPELSVRQANCVTGFLSLYAPAAVSIAAKIHTMITVTSTAHRPNTKLPAAK